MSTLILIPARMASTRLPGKPLADICGEPMIVHVWRRAIEADIGRVVVATDDAAMTAAHHVNGTSRIDEALDLVGEGAEIIVNFQGDIPTVAPETVRAA